jgi:hypothetical protein
VRRRLERTSFGKSGDWDTETKQLEKSAVWGAFGGNEGGTVTLDPLLKVLSSIIPQIAPFVNY